MIYIFDKCKIKYSTLTHDHLNKLSKVYKPIKVKSFFFQILNKNILMTLAHRWCIVLIIKTWNLPGFEPTRKLNLGFLRKIPWLATLNFEVKSQISSSTFFESKGFSGGLRCLNLHFWDSQRWNELGLSLLILISISPHHIRWKVYQFWLMLKTSNPKEYN